MLAIIGAMQIEVDAILAKFDKYETKEIKHVKVYEGKLHNRDAVVALSGVGKVNAALTCATLINNYDLDLVINIGTAGGLSEEENTLDIVIANNTIQYDFDTTAIDGESGKGIINKCDDLLNKQAYNLLESDEYNVFFGDIACGDRFVSETSQLDAIKENFKTAIACDMESGSIAQVCEINEIRCIILRSLSDIVHKDNSHLDFMAYAKKASERSGEFVSSFVKSL